MKYLYLWFMLEINQEKSTTVYPGLDQQALDIRGVAAEDDQQESHPEGKHCYYCYYTSAIVKGIQIGS